MSLRLTSVRPPDRESYRLRHQTLDLKVARSSQTQTFTAFLRETYRKQRNSGAHVKLGGGFEIGIAGESFHLPELQRIRSQD
jgi:hypothetical protein